MFARRLLYSLFLVAVLTFVAGYFLGWFDISSREDADGDVKVELKVDKDKFRQDATNVIEGAQELGDEVKKEINEDRDK